MLAIDKIIINRAISLENDVLLCLLYEQFEGSDEFVEYCTTQNFDIIDHYNQFLNELSPEPGFESDDGNPMYKVDKNPYVKDDVDVCEYSGLSHCEESVNHKGTDEDVCSTRVKQDLHDDVALWHYTDGVPEDERVDFSWCYNVIPDDQETECEMYVQNQLNDEIDERMDTDESAFDIDLDPRNRSRGLKRKRIPRGESRNVVQKMLLSIAESKLVTSDVSTGLTNVGKRLLICSKEKRNLFLKSVNEAIKVSITEFKCDEKHIIYSVGSEDAVCKFEESVQTFLCGENKTDGLCGKDDPTLLHEQIRPYKDPDKASGSKQ